MHNADSSAQWDTIIRPRRRWFDMDLKGLIRYRDLIWLLIKRNFTLVYHQTVLGPLWIIIQPLLTSTIFTVVFGTLAGLPTDGMPKFLFYMSGNVMWYLFAGCLTTTSTTFVTNRKLFGKVYFPRLCMPISTMFSKMINFFVQFALFLGLVIYYAVQPNTAVQPNWALIAVTPLLILQIGLLGVGCGLIVSALTTRYRDLAMLVSFGIQLWMYASPVTYSSSMIAEKYPQLLGLYMINPVTPIIEQFRSAYLGGSIYSPLYSLISLGITAAIVLLGMVLFSRTEKTFMDTV